MVINGWWYLLPVFHLLTRNKSVYVELYFHLINHWCYQPDAGGRCDLLHATEDLSLLLFRSA